MIEQAQVRALLESIAAQRGMSLDELLSALFPDRKVDISRIQVREKRVTIEKFNGDRATDPTLKPVETVIFEDGRNKEI